MEKVNASKEFGSMVIDVVYSFGRETNSETGMQTKYQEATFVKITVNGKVVKDYAELVIENGVAQLGHSGTTVLSQETLAKVLEVVAMCKADAANESEVAEQEKEDAEKAVIAESNKKESSEYDDHAARVESMMTLNGRSY